MGNPHAVQIVKDVDVAAVATEGPEIESLNAFPNKVNAGFMQIQNRHKIKLRVFERGSGETLACGTGACAAAVSGILRGELDSPVVVHTRGGDLTIAWDLNSASQSSVMMTGPAQTVFEGEITIE
jgi:diaminopimelate epimerase